MHFPLFIHLVWASLISNVWWLYVAEGGYSEQCSNTLQQQTCAGETNILDNDGLRQFVALDSLLRLRYSQNIVAGVPW